MYFDISQIVQDFATAFKAIDTAAPQGQSKTRTYRPGIGPLTEDVAVKSALDFLKLDKPESYGDASTSSLYPYTRLRCDLVLPSRWAIEFKLIRPYGDNGMEAEHWSENVLHPYLGTTSAIGDCMKLSSLEIAPRKGVIVFGYEHTPPQIALEPAIRAFEVIAKDVMQIRLSNRHTAEFKYLIHPIHQQGKVYGWEILG